MNHVADLLEMPPIRVYEVATFYTMFNLRPVGRYCCRPARRRRAGCAAPTRWSPPASASSASAWAARRADGLFTLVEVECLGACVNAPILQVNDDFYEDLDGPKTEALLDALRDGKPPRWAR